MQPAAQEMTRLPRGHGEGLSDAWANMYIDIANLIMGDGAGTQSSSVAEHVPDVHQGLRGIRFVETAADSHQAGGVWMDLD